PEFYAFAWLPRFSVVDMSMEGFRIGARREQHHRRNATPPLFRRLCDEGRLLASRIGRITPADAVPIHGERIAEIARTLRVLILRGHVERESELGMDGIEERLRCCPLVGRTGKH